MWGLGWQAVQAQEERAPPAAKSPPGLHAFETPELPIYQYPNHPLVLDSSTVRLVPTEGEPAIATRDLVQLRMCPGEVHDA
jgi:hypothetical protein